MPFGFRYQAIVVVQVKTFVFRQCFCVGYCGLPNSGRCGGRQYRVSVNCPVADPLYPCETRQDTWRIKQTRKGQQFSGKAPSKTIGATMEGSRQVDRCDDGEKGREGSQGIRLSLEVRLPLSISPEELGSLDYILYWAT